MELHRKEFESDVSELMESRNKQFYSISKFRRPTLSGEKPVLPKYLLPILPFDVGPNNLFRAFKARVS